MKALRSAGLAGTSLGLAAACGVALATSGAYREGDVLGVLLALVLPPLILFFVYDGAEKGPVFSLCALLVSAVLLNVAPLVEVRRHGTSLALIMVAAMAVPLATDLLLIDMGKRLRIDRWSARSAALAFAVAVLPLAAWMLASAHRFIQTEDAKLIDELAARMSPEGDALVVERLDDNLRDKAQRRVAVRTRNGRSYSFSDADVESVREERTISTRRNARDGGAETHVTTEQEDRLRLILKLQGTALPDDVILYSRRGPLTITEMTVPLPKQGRPGSSESPG